MYLIALCDDMKTELNKTEQMLRGYEKEHPEVDFKIERFDCADKLLYFIEEKDYMPDLILIDIYMPGKTGIDAARTLRIMGMESAIVFLTSSKEHALDAFSVNAAQYLVKPLSTRILFPILDRILTTVEKERRKYLLLQIEGKIQRIPVNDIIYCEAQRKIQYLHLSNNSQCLLRMTMSKIGELLCPYQQFVRVGIAYIINLDHIVNLNQQSIYLDTGKNVYPPRGAYKTLREQYFRYYCEEQEPAFRNV